MKYNISDVQYYQYIDYCDDNFPYRDNDIKFLILIYHHMYAYDDFI